MYLTESPRDRIPGPSGLHPERADAADAHGERDLDPDDALVPGWDAFLAARSRYLTTPPAPPATTPAHEPR